MLSVIAKGFFTESPLLFFPVLALVVFMAVFTVITVKALRSSQEAIQHVAGLPLDDGQQDTTREKDQDHE